MDCGGAEGREGRGHGWWRGNGDGNGDKGTGGHIGTRGGGKLDEGRGPRPGSFLGRRACRGDDVAGSSPDSQGEEGLTGHRPCGGDVEGSSVDSKSPFHSLHHLSRLLPWVMGRSGYRHRHPQGQADTTDCSLEGGGPLHDFIGTAQGVQRLGQVKVPGNPGGIRHQAPGQKPTLKITGTA